MTSCCFTFTLIILWLSCTIYVGGQGLTSERQFAAASEEVPFISCSVCGKALKHIRKQVRELRKDAASKGATVDEDDILTIVEASCNPNKKQGSWIPRYDIIEQDDSLQIVEHESQRRCQQECRTISRACEESIGDIDTDVGELLWKDDMKLSKLINKVCYEMTDACTKKIPKLKKGKRNDEVFKPMSDKEKKAYDVMSQMRSAPGMPGMEVLYREDIDQMVDKANNPQSNDKPDIEEEASSETAVPAQTGLGFVDTIKAAISNLYSGARKLFSFGWKRTEL